MSMVAGPRPDPSASPLPDPSDSPLPDPSWEPLRGFWAGAAAGELRIPRCAGCGALCWYPAPRCPRCGSGELSWATMSGRGALFSWAVVRRALWAPYAPLVPYATGLVALEEDPTVRIVTRLVDCDFDALRIDLPLRAVFRPLPFAGEPPVIAPFFTPAR